MNSSDTIPSLTANGINLQDVRWWKEVAFNGKWHVWEVEVGCMGKEIKSNFKYPVKYFKFVM